MHPLKRLRVWVSAAVLAASALPFLDLHGLLPAGVIDALLFPQLVPALAAAGQGTVLAALAVVLVLALTLVFGRVFCSFLCPLGTLQDIAIRLARRGRQEGRRPGFRYERPRNGVRYGVLVLVAASTLTGSLALVGLLDPFGLFGRAAAGIGEPAAALANDAAAHGLAGAGVYALPPAGVDPPGAAALLLAVLGVAAVLTLAARRGRLYCNTVCPVGALLGLLARRALFRVAIDRARCTRCAECALACRASCIRVKGYSVDASRCVACFDCLPACPEGGVRLRLGGGEPGPPAPAGPDPVRRALLARAGPAGAVALGLAAAGATRALAPAGTAPAVAPPSPAAPAGVGSLARLHRTCTACQLCVAACPTGVLQPAVTAYGLAGLLQPHLDFARAYCTYECVRCTEVCPTGAIAPLGVEAKKRVQVGRVRFVEDLCVVVTDRTDCGACAEHCPARAVRMVPWEDALTLPEIDADSCVGCGACEHACPVRPVRAILVDGSATHGVAAPPREEAPLAPLPAGGGFPF
jgi:ferredoxin